MTKKRVLRGLLAILFITGFTVCLTGCGVDSGSRGGKPAYQTPGSNYTGGGSGGSSGGGGTSGGGGASGGGSGTPTTTSGADGGSGCSSPKEMFDYINQMRGEYANHGGYDGYPWKGTNKDPYTWSVKLSWDDALAKEAQTEADAVAGSGSPKGERFAYQNVGGAEAIWLTGIDTPKYMLSAKSDINIEGKGAALEYKWHSKGNGTVRMGVFYQTGTDPHANKCKLGVGKADLSDGSVWWVLIFGE